MSKRRCGAEARPVSGADIQPDGRAMAATQPVGALAVLEVSRGRMGTMPEAPLPDVDFARIRPYGHPPSRTAAFEELASILIEQGVVIWPAGVRFERFGNPDGGREGRGILPNGDVWAWQAKYLFDFDAAAVGQVTSSVRRVINLEPNLKRYFVAMPVDLPAGDTHERTSAHTRWTQKVADWQQLAAEKGLTVETPPASVDSQPSGMTSTRRNR
jgi:hypothetical protein